MRRKRSTEPGRLHGAPPDLESSSESVPRIPEEDEVTAGIPYLSTVAAQRGGFNVCLICPTCGHPI